MRSRLSLFFDDLALEEILFLEEELDRRKEKYRRNYSVLVIQADRSVMRSENAAGLDRFHRDMRRFVSSNAAVGGGTVLYFSPDVSVILFSSVAAASRGCSALLSALPELHGQYRDPGLRIGLKMGLATGHDMLAPGSPRSVRASQLVRRASQAAARGTAGVVLMDDNSYHEWLDKLAVEPVPFDLDGQHMYRAIPGMIGRTKARYDDEALMGFLRAAAAANIPTLKYDLERLDSSEIPGDIPPNSVRVKFEGYDAGNSRNLIFTEIIAISDYGDRIEAVKRMLSSMGLALVRHETSASLGV